ncbi:hypothetical protein LPJ61_006396 [Coemansia biformis]|uniref:Mid2 domain-containing protein n=1 Tax=Coemansia biformis TaxID=1286918 RepID=A0A9W7XUQ0_9FUNG|nr:hypothetical protein LPJ61_006396 [Coemansia biformis]
MGGTNLCSYTSVRSYYTLLGDFIPFIRGIVGKDVGYKAPDNSTTPQANPNFGVIFAAATSDKDASLISGDLLAPRDDSKPTLATHTRATPTSVKSSSSEATSTKTTSSDQSTATLGDASDTSNNSESDSAVDSSPSGLSKRAITIIAAVCGSLGTLLLVALGIFLYRWYRGHIRRIHDPYHAPSVRDMLEDMFNNPDDQPPPPLYRPQDRPSTRAAKAAEDAARNSLKK